MNRKFKQIGQNIGLLLGVLLFIPSLIAGYKKTDFIISNTTFIIIVSSIVLLGIIAISLAKKSLNGIISFKQCFATYFIMILIGLSSVGILNYLFFNYVKKDFVSKIRVIQINNLKEHKTKIINNEDLTDDEKDQEIKSITTNIEHIKTINPYSISGTFKNTISFIAMFSILGLLISLILKTKR